MGWSPLLHTRFLVSRTTLDPASLISFFYRTFTFFGSPSQTILLPSISRFRSPLPSICKQLEFRLFLFRSPLLQESSFLSFPVGTKMFQFPTFPSYTLLYSCMDNLSFTQIEFPHSDIHGSRDICSFPWLFAAYHVLLRLLVPRYPPYALCSLTYFIEKLRPTSLIFSKFSSMYSVLSRQIFFDYQTITRF